MTGVFASACLLAAMVVVAWPARSPRQRRRRLGLPAAGRGGPDLPARILPGLRRGVVPAVAAAAVLGLLLSGPVAAALAAGYGAIAVRWWTGRERRRAAALARARVLDGLGSLAADLRAGLPSGRVTASMVGSPVAGEADPLTARAAAAVSLAESTGAPLADLLERIEADARASDRAAVAAEAQSAGARATALLLAALPAGGLALGYAIGADPLPVLLHTPLGAACALAALALQIAGLAWSARLSRPVMA